MATSLRAAREAIAAVGRDLPRPPDARVIDAAGRWVLPGLVEAHGHVGVNEEGEGWAGQDTNETTQPVAAHVRALDAINPADIGFRDAISGGVLAVNAALAALTINPARITGIDDRVGSIEPGKDADPLDVESRVERALADGEVSTPTPTAKAASPTSSPIP